MTQKFHFLANSGPEATELHRKLVAQHGQTAIETADVIVAIGGDGTLLNALRKSAGRNIPVYGINRGSVGFLMNTPSQDDLAVKIGQAESVTIHPLKNGDRGGSLIKVTKADGRVLEEAAGVGANSPVAR